MWDVILKYWVTWICALIAGGIALWAKHIVKLEKKNNEARWQEKEKNMCGKIIDKIESEIQDVENKTTAEDKKIYQQLDAITKSLANITAGLLSSQGKQFIDFCHILLDPNHHITVDEFERFEKDYQAYKGLGGNSEGDTFHNSVIVKFNAQLAK